jgi:hypothetical protein
MSQSWIFLKSAALVVCLFLIQAVVLLISALSFNGCTKYVPLTAIEALSVFVWQVWGMSFAANLIVLSIFLSNFLRRPKLLVRGWSLATFLVLLIWKGISIAQDVKHASKCGEARDFSYPAKLTWINADVLFVLCFVAWVSVLIFAVTALSEQTDRD